MSLPQKGLHSPLQVTNLFVFVVFLIFHFTKNLQQSVHLGLRLRRILFISGNFLFKGSNALGQLRVGLSLQGCILSLSDNKKLIRNHPIRGQKQ